jgi:acid phosphatase (class A)
MLRNHLAVMVLAVGFVGAAAKADAKYITPGDIDVKALLPAPPAPGSNENNKEIEELLKLQDSRTAEDVKNARAEVKETPFLYSEVLGSSFNPDDLPFTRKFFAQISADTKGVFSPAKKLFGRPRPYDTDPRIVPCVEKEASDSYPSGHATYSRVWALTLAEIFPEKKDALMAVADRIALDRCKAGMHYPSDIAAGKKLADAIFAEIEKNPDFQADLAKVKEECLAHVKAPMPAVN